MTKKLKKPNFLDLQKHWYKILKESGFQDIEDCNNKFRPLKSWHSFKWANRDSYFIEAKIKYYTDAVHFLSEYEFETPEQKTIWMLHSEGFSVREIERELFISRSSVHKIICDLRDIMRELIDE